MKDQELNDYISNLIKQGKKSDDVIINFLLDCITKTTLELKESYEQVKNIQQNLQRAQLQQNGLFANRISYINDIKKRVMDITQKEKENEK